VEYCREHSALFSDIAAKIGKLEGKVSVILAINTATLIALTVDILLRI
jgi:hypothetical protein